MRILLVTPTFLPVWGGAERLLYEVFTRVGRSHEIRVVTPEPPAAAANPEILQQLPPLPFGVARYPEQHPWDRARGRRFHRGYFPPFGMSGVKAVFAETRAFRPDLISVFYGVPTGLAGLVSKWLRRTPMVLSLIGRDVPGPTTPPGWGLWNRLLIRAADETTYISEYCRTALFGRGGGSGVTVGNASQTYPDAPPGEVERLRHAYGIAPGTTVLFALQRLSIYKGVDVLIESMTHLREQPCTLLIAGDGSDRGALQASIESKGLGDRVRLLGFLDEDEMAAHWALADMFVFHSYYETFGMVLAEAMHAGKPIVTVDSTAIPEVVEHERTGLLVEPGDPNAFAGAIRRMLTDSESRAEMVARGREKAARDFTWDTVARSYQDIFEEVAQR